MNRDISGNQADRAFAERTAAQAAVEREQHRGQSKIIALDHVNLVIPDGQTPGRGGAFRMRQEHAVARDRRVGYRVRRASALR